MKRSLAGSVIFLGATGAVGTQALKTLLTLPEIQKISLLGRRPVDWVSAKHVGQHKVDIFSPESYNGLMEGHNTAVCTLGVGQPSKMSKEEFLKIDQQAVIDFAKACKAGGVRHFELLASVGISPDSSSFYLKAKGELVEALKALNFERLSIFKPAMIITPNNRYGVLQGLSLKIFPLLDPLLRGSWRKYRSVKVSDLGGAMARNTLAPESGYEELFWSDFQRIMGR